MTDIEEPGRKRSLEAELLGYALAPFAAYFKQMEAYGTLHRGKMPPDAKVMAYSETEMGTSAAITAGDFRRAKEAMDKLDRNYGGHNARLERVNMADFQTLLQACEAGGSPKPSP
jgi:hypothetical protein